MSERQRAHRNLNPHREARLAMLVWHAEYAAQGGGSMDFYDSLTLHQKRDLRRWCEELAAPKPARLPAAEVPPGCLLRRCSMGELKPCPFNHSPHRGVGVVRTGTGAYRAQCFDCDATGPSAAAEDDAGARVDAVAAWNRRALPADAEYQRLVALNGVPAERTPDGWIVMDRDGKPACSFWGDDAERAARFHGGSECVVLPVYIGTAPSATQEDDHD